MLTTVFNDNFNRPDNSTSLGKNWQVNEPSCVYGIFNNAPQLKANGTDSGSNVAFQQLLDSDVSVEIDFTAAGTTAWAVDNIEFALRCQDYKNYLAIGVAGGDLFFVSVVANGVVGNTFHAIVAGVHTASSIRIYLQGSILQLYINGILALSQDLAATPVGNAYQHNVQHGFSFFSTTANLITDFSIEANSMVPNYLPTSKEQALYSLYEYLTVWFTTYYTPIGGLKAPTIYPIGYQQSFTFPCITIEDVGLAGLPAYALGDVFGAPYQGKRGQTIVKLTCYDQNDDTTQTNVAYSLAEQNVRRLRDLVEWLLITAGKTDNNGTFISSPIYMLDPIVSGLPGIQPFGGFVLTPKTEEAGGFRDMFHANASEAPNLKKYEMFIKVEWPQLFFWPSGVVI